MHFVSLVEGGVVSDRSPVERAWIDGPGDYMTQGHAFAAGFDAGVAWSRSPEAVERAAKAIYDVEHHGDYASAHPAVRERYEALARAALTSERGCTPDCSCGLSEFGMAVGRISECPVHAPATSEKEKR